jgi:hypothetical protein
MGIREVKLGPKSRFTEATPAGPAEQPVVKGAGLVGCGCGRQTMSRAAVTEKDWPVVDGVEHRYGLQCRPVPERAGREGDQPLPVVGSESVFARIRAKLDEREKLGITRYGRSLETFNGRDAHRDELEEFVDGYLYREQSSAEHRAVVEALLALARNFPRPAYSEVVKAALALADKLKEAPGV